MGNDRTIHSHDSDDDDPGRVARDDLYTIETELGWRQEQESPRDHEALSKLLQVVELINADLDIERVLKIAAQQIVDIFEAEQVFVADFGPEQRIRFRLAVNFKGEPVPNPKEQVSHAIIREVARTREPALVRNAVADPRFAEVSSVRHLRLHSVMVAPLLARETLLGVVYADNRSIPDAFDMRALNLLAILANHIGIALRNARLFHELDTARAELAQSERLRTLGQIATFVAHEIKNPLASIAILVDSLREKWDDPQRREKAVTIVPQEVARLNKAVGKILDYARPTPLIKVALSLSALLESACRLLGPQIEEAAVTVSKHFEPELPAVFGDGERLREVFVNILRNSLQAVAGRDQRAVKIFVRRSDETHEQVIIEDTGPGLSEADTETIFEPFVSSKKSGSGLGLTLCQKVVREHGGYMAAENIPESGARFTVSLPIKGA